MRSFLRYCRPEGSANGGACYRVTPPKIRCLGGAGIRLSSPNSPLTPLACFLLFFFFFFFLIAQLRLILVLMHRPQVDLPQSRPRRSE